MDKSLFLAREWIVVEIDLNKPTNKSIFKSVKNNLLPFVLRGSLLLHLVESVDSKCIQN